MAFKLFFGSPAAGGAPTAYTLTADTGTLVLTGNAAVTQAARNLIAASGAIVLTGVAATTLVVSKWQFLGVSNVVEVTGTAHALVTTGITGTLAAGDLLVACIASRIASTTSITLPTGGEWTLVSEQKNNNTATNTTATPSGLMAYCVRGASNPNLTFTHPTAPSVALGRIVAYRNVSSTAPKDTQSSFTTATAITAVSGAGLTTTQDKDLIVAMAAGGQEAAWSNFDTVSLAHLGSGSTSTSAPSTTLWLERADSVTTTGADTSLGIFDAVVATAAATGNFTCTASVSAAHVVIAGAFKFAPASLAYSLTATTEAFILAGQPAALTTIRHYKLLATTGALTLTGFATGTQYGRTLTAASGAIALTGFAAGTQYGRKLIAVSGTIALTGFAAELISLTAKELIADTGSILLTGNAAVTRYARKLIAASGALTLTGNAAITRYARKLIATSSTFLLSGSAAILRRARILAAATGTIVWSGFAAALSTTVARSMLAATGTLTLTGADATLRVAHVYKLIATSGTFVLTGAAAAMWRARTLVATPDAFVLTGFAANFFTNRVIVAWSDSIVLTGMTATLRIWRIPPPPEMLRFGRTVYAIPGRW